MKSVAQWSLTLFIVLAAILLGETEPVKQSAAFINRYKEPLTWIAGGMLALGIVLLLTGAVILQVLHGIAMTRRDMAEVAARATAGARSVGWAWIWGPFRGIKVLDAFSVRDLKAARRSPGLIRDPAWQRRMVSFVGMIFTIYGAFSLGFVLAPPASVKLIIGVFVLGSLAQLARLIYRS